MRTKYEHAHPASAPKSNPPGSALPTRIPRLPSSPPPAPTFQNPRPPRRPFSEASPSKIRDPALPKLETQLVQNSRPNLPIFVTWPFQNSTRSKFVTCASPVGLRLMCMAVSQRSRPRDCKVMHMKSAHAGCLVNATLARSCRVQGSQDNLRKSIAKQKAVDFRATRLQRPPFPL